MKKLIVLIIYCLPLMIKAQENKKYEGVQWTEALSWEEVKAKAKKENKYIFIDAYATWCGPCKMMDRDIYPHFRAGHAMNEHFINIKVQMDKTSIDNEQVKSWYATAEQMMKDYKIDAFPSYLFFSPDGHLVHKETGYKDLQSFMRLGELARDPQKPLMYALYEDYKKGKKDLETLGELALFTRKLIGDTKVANDMARDYKEGFLDNLQTKEISKSHIDFLRNFSDLVHSKDQFFKLAYYHPKKYDSLSNVGAAGWLVNRTIKKEQLDDKILANGKAVIRLPQWDKVQKRIERKYKKVDARKLVLQYKIDYYKNLFIDWPLWAKYKDEMIKTYPLKPPYRLDVYIDINGHGGAWHAFLHCPDTAVLNKVLNWVDLAIKLDGGENLTSYLDTKANLLYKLGRIKKAMETQMKAVEILAKVNPNASQEFYAIYKQMSQGKPTYINEGAVWDKASLERISR